MAPTKLLLLDPDPRPAAILGARLDVEILSCGNLAEAQAAVESGCVAMVVGEVAFERDFDGLEAMGRWQAAGIPCVVWTARSIDDLIGAAREAELGVLMAKTAPLLVDEIALAWKMHREGWRPGLSKFLGPGSVAIGTESAIALDEVAALCRRIQAGLEGGLSSSRRLRLVLDEMLSNAIHHSPLGTATMSWGRDACKHVFSVRDPSGVLRPNEAMRLLERHVRGEGLLDSRGRGLHLSRIYADRLYVNVVPGKVTEVAAVFWHPQSVHQGFKPVWMLTTRLAEN